MPLILNELGTLLKMYAHTHTYLHTYIHTYVRVHTKAHRHARGCEMIKYLNINFHENAQDEAKSSEEMG